jgi:hypothetical protein
MNMRIAGYGERQMVVSAGRLTDNSALAEIRHQLRRSAMRYQQSSSGITVALV